MQSLIDLLRLDTQHRLTLLNQPLGHHFNRGAYSRRGGALGTARLQQIERAVLHRELNVLHVTKVVFEALADINQIGVDVRHEAAQRTNMLRITDTSDHVLALSIRQKFSVQIFFTSRWVTRKHHPCPGVLTTVAEDHSLHVHCCAPVLRNPVQLAIGHRPIVMPGGKHRIDAQA